MAVPYTFGTATASIPLSNLDSNFATTITLGNTAIQLGNTVTTLNNMTLANVTVSSGNLTLTNVSATLANVTTANIGTAVITGTSTLTGLTASTALALDASKNIASVTNTGTGNNVLATSPTLVTPALGTPASGVLTNCTGLPQGGLAAGVAGNGPSFMAYNNANQSISSATFTKVRFNAEEWDTNNNFDSTTNYRFTPTVAGYYQCSFAFSTEPSTATVTRIIGLFYKNGAEYKFGNDFVGANVTASEPVGSCLIYCNGSTDYVEIYGYMAGGTPVIRGTQSTTWFTAFLARSA
jgi:hypothetical protein